jgi:lipid-A-disaccharide synthase
MGFRQMMVVAGEASGDRHAASLLTELAKRLPETRFFGMGGPLLEAAGLERIYAADEVSVMGITEVVPKLPRILRVMKGLTHAAARRLPLGAILVDIPDFNLRLAARLKRLGIKVFYFVSPMIWAWRRYRIHQIANWVDLMLCILPFEEALYRRAGIRARYIGSPVLDQVPTPASQQEFRRRLGLAVDRPTLALLPGSRSSEVERIFPWMIEAAKQIAPVHPDLQVIVPVSHSIARSQLASASVDSALKPILLDGQAPEAVGASDIAVVASGTATLEAALMKRPLIAVYRMAPISYWLGRLLVRVPHVSLVNLIAEQRIVPELLQGKMAPEKLAVAIDQLWSSQADQEEMIRGFDRVRERLGPRGAAGRAAEEIVSML